MINNISKGKAQEENMRKYEQDKHNENNTNVKEIIEEMKNEFKNQMKQKTINGTNTQKHREEVTMDGTGELNI